MLISSRSSKSLRLERGLYSDRNAKERDSRMSRILDSNGIQSSHGIVELLFAPVRFASITWNNTTNGCFYSILAHFNLLYFK